MAMTTQPVPVTVMEEAAARVKELGLQKEFDQMLEHTRQTVPGLRSIFVYLQPPYDTGDEPCVIIEAMMPNRGLPYNPVEDEWGAWRVNTFSPDVFRHFVMLTVYGDGHGR
jgi:hypothetical protein